MEDEKEERAEDPSIALSLPFKRASATERRLKGTGLCIQGNFGQSTHVGTLKYALDFRMPVGTLIVAVRRGIVAAVVSHFTKGGLDSSLRPRANFVAVQHQDGTYARYFHLKHEGALVSKGDKVEASDPLGYSGNTGFSSTPHLHFDVVNCLPEDTSCVAVIGGRQLQSVVAAFSAPLSSEPVSYRVVEANPIDARYPLVNTDEVRGCAVLIDRGGCSFTSKVKHAVQVCPHILFLVVEGVA